MEIMMEDEQETRMRAIVLKRTAIELKRKSKLHTEKANRGHKLSKMLNLANQIKSWEGINGPNTFVDEILNRSLEDYEKDHDLDTKIDKLKKLYLTERKRQIETTRFWNFACANAHLISNIFVFEIEGRQTLFNCGTKSLKELQKSIVSKVGTACDLKNPPKIMYKDEHGDMFVIASDIDLTVAINYARSTGWTKLILHLEYSATHGPSRVSLGFGSMAIY